MTQRMIAETVCDGCGATERRDQNVPFIPAGWRIAQTGYMGTNGFIAEQTKMLCPDCLAKVIAVWTERAV